MNVKTGYDVSVELNLKQIEEFSDVLKQIKKARRREYLEEVGQLMLKSIDQNFKRQGRYSSTDSIKGGSTRWKALSPMYAKWKKKHYPRKKIGERTGWMRKSFDYQIDQKLTNVKLVNMMPYAKHFDKWRPMLVVQDEDIRNIQAIGMRYATKDWDVKRRR